LSVWKITKSKNGTNQKALSNVTNPINHYSFNFGYLYDANGNQYADFNKGIAWIQFNSLNLPRKIQVGNGNKAEYFYDATGVKYKAQWGYAATPQNIPLGATGTEYQSPTGVSRTEYCGNYVYENGNLRRIVTPEGYVATNNTVTEVMIRNTWRHRYLLKDHLGNTRRTLNANALNSTSPTVIPSGQLIDYYPFGLEITRVSNPEGEDYSPSYLAGATIPYLYNGKEIDRMHGLNCYDYGARYYDGATGRWHGVDPLAEKKPWISHYVYCRDNPMNMIDPDGRDEWEVNDSGFLKKIPNTESKIDKIFPIDNEGKRKVEVKPHELEKGTLDKLQSHPDFENPLSPDVHKLTISSDNGADKLAEFLWNNTKVEFTLTKSSETNYITTSHEEKKEQGLDRAINRGFIKGVINEHIHNHPSNNPNPSKSDIKTKTNVQKLTIFKNTVFKIYTKKKNNATNYHTY
jgi:RHS repeat-associated protein